jgi:hypothetical protein
MAAREGVAVAGAGGVFGSLLVRELGSRAIPMTRRELDLGDVDSVARVASGALAIACTAGPFQSLDRRIVRACVDAGAHWLDITDDAGWFFGLLDDPELDALARERGVAVLPGLSTLPAISGALLRRLLPAQRVTVTLTIHNRNRKGPAAIASAAERFHPPDRALFRRELGVDAEARVAFEMPGVGAILRVLGALPSAQRLRAARLLSRLASPFRLGRPGGSVEVRTDDGRVARVEGNDQRLAILPLVYALEHLDGITGVHAPSIFNAEALLATL